MNSNESSGYIYISSNPSFRFGLIKIGQTGRDDPRKRLEETGRHTGVPEPFELEYSAYVQDYVAVERAIHRKLSAKRNRRNREYFNCSIPEAIRIVRETASIIEENVFYKSPEEIREEMERAKQEKIQEQAKLERERQERQLQQQKLEAERREKIEETKENTKRILLWGGAAGFVIFLLTLEDGWIFLALPVASTVLGLIPLLLIGGAIFIVMKLVRSFSSDQDPETKTSSQNRKSITGQTAKPNKYDYGVSQHANLAGKKSASDKEEAGQELYVFCDACGAKNRLVGAKLKKRQQFAPICGVCSSKLKLPEHRL